MDDAANETVSRTHVETGLRPVRLPGVKRRREAVLAGAMFGVAAGQFFNVLYDLAQAEGAPGGGPLLLLLGCFVVALASGYVVVDRGLR